MNKQPYYHEISIQGLAFSEKTLKKILRPLINRQLAHTLEVYEDAETCTTSIYFTNIQDVTVDAASLLKNNAFFVNYCEADPGDPADLI